MTRPNTPGRSDTSVLDDVDAIRAGIGVASARLSGDAGFGISASFGVGASDGGATDLPDHNPTYPTAPQIERNAAIAATLSFVLINATPNNTLDDATGAARAGIGKASSGSAHARRAPCWPSSLQRIFASPRLMRVRTVSTGTPRRRAISRGGRSSQKRDAAEPRAQTRAFWRLGGQRREHRLLHEVVGRVWIAHERAGEPAQPYGLREKGLRCC